MCWHSTLTLIQIGMHVCGMSLHMLGWTLVSLVQIYFISFGFTPIVIYFRILPCELIDSLCMGQVSGQAITYIPYILSWCSHRVIIHLFNQTWDASNVCISFIFFLVIHLMCEYHQGLSMIGFKFKIYFIFSFTVQRNHSLWNIELTLMNWAEREKFCGVLLSCCPTLCFTKYLVSSIVITSGSLFLIST